MQTGLTRLKTGTSGSLVNAVKKLWFHKRWGMTITFSKIVLHGINYLVSLVSKSVSHSVDQILSSRHSNTEVWASQQETKQKKKKRRNKN